MDTHQVVKRLQDEREGIVAAIVSRQRPAAGKDKETPWPPPSGYRKPKNPNQRAALESLGECGDDDSVQAGAGPGDLGGRPGWVRPSRG
jgi:hypothetical protein